MSNNKCPRCKHDAHPTMQCVECFCKYHNSTTPVEYLPDTEENNPPIPPAVPIDVSDDDASRLNQVRQIARSLGLAVEIEGRNITFILEEDEQHLDRHYGTAKTTVTGVALAIVFLRAIEFISQPHRFITGKPGKWMDAFDTADPVGDLGKITRERYKEDGDPENKWQFNIVDEQEK